MATTWSSGRNGSGRRPCPADGGSSRPRRIEDRVGPDRGGSVPAGDLCGRSDAGLGICHHGVRTRREGPEGIAAQAEAVITEEAMKKQNRFPPGWNEARVQRVLAHYERQSDTEAV